MKKFFTLTALIIATTTFSQGIKLYKGTPDVGLTEVTNTIITEKIKDGVADINTKITVFNNGAKDNTYLVRRTLTNTTKQTDYYMGFCSGGLCYPNTEDPIFEMDKGSAFLLKTKAYIPESKIDTARYGISAHLETGLICEDHIVLYEIWSDSIPGDKAKVTIHYACATGIDEFDAGNISAAYPNPANNTVAIDYSLNSTPKNAKVVFYDMLGKTVKAAGVVNKEGTVKVNVEDLHSGFYFYTFIVDGKSTNTRKLVISAK